MNIIQHNMTSIYISNNLKTINKSKQKNTERLSSGYKINRAADNAAGLTISEKMRGQIRGLEKASTNTLDGINMIQTADGAMSEIHAILQRMRELSVQAANDTNTSVDRSNSNMEVQSLKNEINKIIHESEFNTIKLFDHDMPEVILHPKPDLYSDTLIGSNGVTIVSGKNDTLTYYLDDVYHSITLDEGFYSSNEIVKALNEALASENQSNAVTVSINDAGFGNLVYKHEGYTFNGLGGNMMQISSNTVDDVSVLYDIVNTALVDPEALKSKITGMRDLTNGIQLTDNNKDFSFYFNGERINVDLKELMGIAGVADLDDHLDDDESAVSLPTNKYNDYGEPIDYPNDDAINTSIRTFTADQVINKLNDYFDNNDIKLDAVLDEGKFLQIKSEGRDQSLKIDTSSTGAWDLLAKRVIVPSDLSTHYLPKPIVYNPGFGSSETNAICTDCKCVTLAGDVNLSSLGSIVIDNTNCNMWFDFGTTNDGTREDIENYHNQNTVEYKISITQKTYNTVDELVDELQLKINEAINAKGYAENDLKVVNNNGRIELTSQIKDAYIGGLVGGLVNQIFSAYKPSCESSDERHLWENTRPEDKDDYYYRTGQYMNGKADIICNHAWSGSGDITNGVEIIAGYNDKITLKIGTGPPHVDLLPGQSEYMTFTLAEGKYTAEEMLNELNRQMTPVGIHCQMGNNTSESYYNGALTFINANKNTIPCEIDPDPYDSRKISIVDNDDQYKNWWNMGFHKEVYPITSFESRNDYYTGLPSSYKYADTFTITAENNVLSITLGNPNENNPYGEDTQTVEIILDEGVWTVYDIEQQLREKIAASALNGLVEMIDGKDYLYSNVPDGTTSSNSGGDDVSGSDERDVNYLKEQYATIPSEEVRWNGYDTKIADYLLSIVATSKGDSYTIQLGGSAFDTLYRTVYSSLPEAINPREKYPTIDGRLDLDFNSPIEIEAGLNDELTFDLTSSVDGVNAYTIKLAAGSYDSNGLIDAVNDALKTAGLSGIIKATAKMVNSPVDNSRLESGVPNHNAIESIQYFAEYGRYPDDMDDALKVLNLTYIGMDEAATYTIDGIRGNASEWIFYPRTYEAELVYPPKRVLQIGADSYDSFVTDIPIEMSLRRLHILDSNITSRKDASRAIKDIDYAIGYVNAKRSRGGADVNVLEHTVRYLDNQNENLTDAESRIRDADMAEEMVQYSKNNILVQAAQAMMAQANQMPQGVLGLLE